MGTTSGSGAVLLSLCITLAVLSVAAGMLFVSSFLERMERPRPTPRDRMDVPRPTRDPSVDDRRAA